jgi:hypothetical protein
MSGPRFECLVLVGAAPQRSFGTASCWQRNLWANSRKAGCVMRSYGSAMAEDDRWGSREYMKAYRADEFGSPSGISDPTRFVVWSCRLIFSLARWTVRAVQSRIGR